MIWTHGGILMLLVPAQADHRESLKGCTSGNCEAIFLASFFLFLFPTKHPRKRPSFSNLGSPRSSYCGDTTCCLVHVRPSVTDDWECDFVFLVLDHSVVKGATHEGSYLSSFHSPSYPKPKAPDRKPPRRRRAAKTIVKRIARSGM